MTAEELTYLGAGGTAVNGYLARPSEQGPHPGMIVIHEAGGLNDHIRDVCNRFANIGYVTLGVDLYTREGGPPTFGDMQAILERLFSMSDATILGDLEGAADYLRSREDVSGKLGCIGFCMGGRLTLLFACCSEKLDAAVDCWGGFIDTANGQARTTVLRPRPPLELASHVRGPLYAAIGAEDHNPSPEIGERLREQLAKSAHAAECGVEPYDGAGHAFFADYRPTYRPAPARRLWEKIVPFLDEHLKGE
ncbi:MAG: dienelactone hydrolase family protein [Solirubrobacteraceae bacterium]